MNGQQQEALRDALREAYNLNTLDQMLLYRLDKVRSDLVASTDFNTVLFHLISAAFRDGWLDGLVREAAAYNPGNTALSEFATAFLSSNKQKSQARDSKSNQLHDVVQELYDLLVVSGQAFDAQTQLRDQLVQRIERRLGDADGLQYEEFFRKHYDHLETEELERHRIIRGYTTELFAKNNTRCAELVELIGHRIDRQCPSMMKLKVHLAMWLAKLRAVFLTSPCMAVLYVGVEERVEFPESIELELAKYLDLDNTEILPKDCDR